MKCGNRLKLARKVSFKFKISRDVSHTVDVSTEDNRQAPLPEIFHVVEDILFVTVLLQRKEYHKPARNRD